MSAPSSKKILEKTRQFLHAHGELEDSASSKDKLRELIIPALQSSKNIQSAFYSWEPPHSKGLARKPKNFILQKLKSIVINILEKSFMRQQKYNELLFQAVSELKTENDDLRKQLAELKK